MTRFSLTCLTLSATGTCIETSRRFWAPPQKVHFDKSCYTTMLTRGRSDYANCFLYAKKKERKLLLNFLEKEGHAGRMGSAIKSAVEHGLIKSHSSRRSGSCRPLCLSPLYFSFQSLPILFTSTRYSQSAATLPFRFLNILSALVIQNEGRDSIIQNGPHPAPLEQGDELFGCEGLL